MRPEEEFDDIFKRRTEGAKFSFNESDWEKARKMIDRERMAAFNSASRINYWYVSALVLMSSIAVLYFALPETLQLAQADEVVYSPETKTAASLSSLPQLAITTQKKEGPANLALAATRFTSKTTTTSDLKLQNAKFDSQTPKVSQVPVSPPIEETPETAPSTQTPLEITTPGAFANDNSETGLQNLENSQHLNLDKIEVSLNTELTEEKLSLQPVILKRYEDYVPSLRFNRHAIDVVMGLNYFGGWDNNGQVSAKGFNGFAGISYSYFLNKKLNLNLGAELYNISNVDQEFYTCTSKNYGFGSIQTQTLLTCQSMLFLSFPIRVYYAADEHHLVGLGVHAGTLLMASNTIETSELSDGLKQNLNTVSSKGVYQGMNTSNILLSASLHKTVGDRLALQLELYYGLSDLFTDTPSNGYQQNSNGIRVGINYRIFRN